MKRYGNLWENIISWENLVLASKKARGGKRDRISVQNFEFNLEGQLLNLQKELTAQTYCPGEFRSHWIYEPKKRMISVAPYRDRVVHHALMNVLEPILDCHFHPDNYACRKTKGTHKAADRLQKLMNRYAYCLQCDIQKFFPSIDHLILKQIFRKLIKDKKVLWLMDLIVDSSNDQLGENLWFKGDDLFIPIERAKGLPIGNLTSQWFANWYLNNLDHFITSHIRIGAYVRYCDDFIVLHNDKEFLKDTVCRIVTYLDKLRLKLNWRKVHIHSNRSGLSFVGYRIWPTHRLLKKKNVKRFQNRLKWLKKEYAIGRLDWSGVKRRLDSWLGYAKHADAKCLVKCLSCNWIFSRGSVENESCSSRRQLEQQCIKLHGDQRQQQHTIESQQQHRISCCPALSENFTRNHSVHGLCERGCESPDSIPVLRATAFMPLGRINVGRHGRSGRNISESPAWPKIFCRQAA